MKKIILIAFICSWSHLYANNSNTVLPKSCLPQDTTALSQILSLPLFSYIGKPVDSLFLMLPLLYSDRGFMPIGIGYCKGVFQSYGKLETNTVTVEIFIDNFQHMVFPNRTKTTTWNMDLAKQEIISYIKVIKNNNICMYGCGNPNYYD